MNNYVYKIVCVISVVYLAVLSIVLLWHGKWFSPDQFFAAALVSVLLLGRFKQFIQDWIAPLVVFFSYEALHGLIPLLSIRVNVFPMIKFDQFFFGQIPSVTLQHLLFSPSYLKWYDYLSVILYESHFVAFLIIGFVFWLKNRDLFRRYFLGIIVLSFAAFATFVVYPAMPPWMAAQKGFIPPLSDISNQVSVNLPKAMSLPTIYQFFGANLVAAVPSMHAAYPWLTFLFLLSKVRLWGLFGLPYVFGVWFAIVYLGDHYVFDIVAGCLYATLAFIFVKYHEEIIKKIKGVIIK